MTMYMHMHVHIHASRYTIAQLQSIELQKKDNRYTRTEEESTSGL